MEDNMNPKKICGILNLALITFLSITSTNAHEETKHRPAPSDFEWKCRPGILNATAPITLVPAGSQVPALLFTLSIKEECTDTVRLSNLIFRRKGLATYDLPWQLKSGPKVINGGVATDFTAEGNLYLQAGSSIVLTLEVDTTDRTDQTIGVDLVSFDYSPADTDTTPLIVSNSGSPLLSGPTFMVR
jgi:hypothetical protein